MERMGHTSPAVALRYQLDELVQAAAELPTEKASGTVVARTRRASQRVRAAGLLVVADLGVGRWR
jgi:hypothetical protein